MTHHQKEKDINMSNRNRRVLQHPNLFQSFQGTNYWASRIYGCLSTIASHAIGLDGHITTFSGHILQYNLCDAINIKDHVYYHNNSP